MQFEINDVVVHPAYEEWASSADISIAEATREIGALLQVTPDAALS